jgi:hypothetical protein
MSISGIKARDSMKSQPGPPMTVGNAAAARVRLIVWCKACSHQVEPDPAELARRHGAETTVPERRERLVGSQCGSANFDMVVTGTERRWNEQRQASPNFGLPLIAAGHLPQRAGGP